MRSNRSLRWKKVDRLGLVFRFRLGLFDVLRPGGRVEDRLEDMLPLDCVILWPRVYTLSSPVVAAIPAGRMMLWPECALGIEKNC